MKAALCIMAAAIASSVAGQQLTLDSVRANVAANLDKITTFQADANVIYHL